MKIYLQAMGSERNCIASSRACDNPLSSPLTNKEIGVQEGYIVELELRPGFGLSCSSASFLVPQTQQYLLWN